MQTSPAAQVKNRQTSAIGAGAENKKRKPAQNSFIM